MEKYSNHPLKGATDIDSSMNMLWNFYKKHFIVLYAISVVSALVSGIISSEMDLAALTSATEPAEMLSVYKQMAVPYLLLILVSLVFSIVTHTYILDKPAGESYSFFETLKKSAIILVPYLAAILIIAFAGVILISLGFVLLIIPGIFALFYVITIYLFTVPVALIESTNPGHIVTRSVKLAHRNLWPNMGWTTVIILIVLIAAIVISALSTLPFTGTLLKSLSDTSVTTDMSKNPVYIIITSLTGALVTPVLPIMAFILYFRNAKEETVTEQAGNNSEERVRVEDLYPKMPEDKE